MSPDTDQKNPILDEPEDPEKRVREARANRRLRGFAHHLGGYFMAMIALVAFSISTDPTATWFVLPMVGWGSVLASWFER